MLAKWEGESELSWKVWKKKRPSKNTHVQFLQFYGTNFSKILNTPLCPLVWVSWYLSCPASCAGFVFPTPAVSGGAPLRPAAPPGLSAEGPALQRWPFPLRGGPVLEHVNIIFYLSLLWINEKSHKLTEKKREKIRRISSSIPHGYIQSLTESWCTFKILLWWMVCALSMHHLADFQLSFHTLTKSATHNMHFYCLFTPTLCNKQCLIMYLYTLEM